MKTALSINLNKIALIRNSREGNFPDVCAHAQACIDHGADGITVHPRPDQRHIRASDVPALAELVAGVKQVEFNVEGNPFAPAMGSYPGFMDLVAASKPDQCTLVPDSDAQLTSDHGFDLTQSGAKLAPIIARLKDQGMRVSLFMDPDISQIELAAKLGADRIELYTGPFAEAFKQHPEKLPALLAQFGAAAQAATALGLGVNAGHDLNLHNLGAFRQAVPALLEVSIGHAFVVDCIALGLPAAMAAYVKACRA
ncbi:pyridoxine 5'-phosphate synthase [Simiduia curdlanivorans]|uniref:Pyridoxine 5'-phosphate synthase n=1 Tax=Simiduia curdlanivorans TaxID=1492769 RepID=A0ABV8V8H8_9GAMM|nr:pyridoxine 5'-phosphate synthase [Simiduia curdlanivorans]MDN3639466.1 pyridoxine 5'-phosphate synthase [Simiduia curdlanivorans]